jgi:hypothetical protein
MKVEENERDKKQIKRLKERDKKKTCLNLRECGWIKFATCPTCGKRISNVEGGKFCAHCGQRIDWNKRNDVGNYK